MTYAEQGNATPSTMRGLSDIEDLWMSTTQFRKELGRRIPSELDAEGEEDDRDAAQDGGRCSGALYSSQSALECHVDMSIGDGRVMSCDVMWRQMQISE